MSQSSKPVPLAVPNELLKLIDEAAKATNRSRSELMRLAIEIGIEDLRRIDFDVPAAVVDAASQVSQTAQSHLFRLPVKTAPHTMQNVAEDASPSVVSAPTSRHDIRYRKPVMSRKPTQ